MTGDLLTVSQAAAMLGVDDDTVRTFIAFGDLPGNFEDSVVGYRIPADEVRELRAKLDNSTDRLRELLAFDSTAEGDRLAPARGFLVACGIGVAFWAVALTIAWAVTKR